MKKEEFNNTLTFAKITFHLIFASGVLLTASVAIFGQDLREAHKIAFTLFKVAVFLSAIVFIGNLLISFFMDKTTLLLDNIVEFVYDKKTANTNSENKKLLADAKNIEQKLRTLSNKTYEISEEQVKTLEEAMVISAKCAESSSLELTKLNREIAYLCFETAYKISHNKTYQITLIDYSIHIVLPTALSKVYFSLLSKNKLKSISLKENIKNLNKYQRKAFSVLLLYGAKMQLASLKNASKISIDEIREYLGDANELLN